MFETPCLHKYNHVVKLLMCKTTRTAEVVRMEMHRYAVQFKVSVLPQTAHTVRAIKDVGNKEEMCEVSTGTTHIKSF